MVPAGPFASEGALSGKLPLPRIRPWFMCESSPVVIGDLQISQSLTMYTNAYLARKTFTSPFNAGSVHTGLCSSLKVLSAQKLVTQLIFGCMALLRVHLTSSSPAVRDWRLELILSESCESLCFLLLSAIHLNVKGHHKETFSSLMTSTLTDRLVWVVIKQ